MGSKSGAALPSGRCVLIARHTVEPPEDHVSRLTFRHQLVL
jgi:hypothetical protein